MMNTDTQNEEDKSEGVSTSIGKELSSKSDEDPVSKPETAVKGQTSHDDVNSAGPSSSKISKSEKKNEMQPTRTPPDKGHSSGPSSAVSSSPVKPKPKKIKKGTKMVAAKNGQFKTPLKRQTQTDGECCSYSKVSRCGTMPKTAASYVSPNKKHSCASFQDPSPSMSRSSGSFPNFSFGPEPAPSSENTAASSSPTGKKTYGFIGIGIMGKGIVTNLLRSDHFVTIWNRTREKCEPLAKAGAHTAPTPADVVAASDITFCCVSDHLAVKELLHGNYGILEGIQPGKAYVEMTSIDPDASAEIAKAIMDRKGRYLEAPLYGSKNNAEDGTLVILTAGDLALFTECESCFHAIGKHAFFLGGVGIGSKMSLTLNMLHGTLFASLAEAMALAESHGLPQVSFLEILSLGALRSPDFIEKGIKMMKGKFEASMPLQHMQKNMSLALQVSSKLKQGMPLCAAANEAYKDAARKGLSKHDVSAVYLWSKF